MPQVAIINQSTVVSDVNGQIITSALNLILPQFCSDWSIASHTCVYVPLRSNTSIPLKIYLMDTSDEAGALAYHDEINDIPYGKAFAKTVLSAGGVLLYSPNPTIPTFAQAVCHELFEMLIDPFCNIWAMLGDNATQYAYEVCDPVESNAVTVKVQTGTSAIRIPSRVLGLKLSTTKIVPTYTSVGLSDWVLPKWFDSSTKIRPFNHNNTLKGPLTLDKHGYVISLSSGTSSIVWGKMVIPQCKEVIMGKLRVSKRNLNAAKH